MIERKCSCEMGMHRAPLEKYIIESGAINHLPELLRDYNKVYMVCDENTYRVLGEKSEQILKSVGKFSHKHILKGDVLPDARNIGDVLIHLNDPKADSDIFKYSPQPDFILAVGSGVVNDICRVVSYRLGLPYGIAGTAPSMDGYASAGSPTQRSGCDPRSGARSPASGWLRAAEKPGVGRWSPAGRWAGPRPGQ